MARWALQLLENDYESVYRKGSSNHIPYALYFYRRDHSKSSLALDSNLWKLTIPIELRKQVLIENHENKQAGPCGMKKTDAKFLKIIFGAECTLRLRLRNPGQF